MCCRQRLLACVVVAALLVSVPFYHIFRSFILVSILWWWYCCGISITVTIDATIDIHSARLSHRYDEYLVFFLHVANIYICMCVCVCVCGLRVFASSFYFYCTLVISLPILFLSDISATLEFRIVSANFNAFLPEYSHSQMCVCVCVCVRVGVLLINYQQLPSLRFVC